MVLVAISGYWWLLVAIISGRGAGMLPMPTLWWALPGWLKSPGYGPGPKVGSRLEGPAFPTVGWPTLEEGWKALQCEALDGPMLAVGLKGRHFKTLDGPA